MVDLQPYLYGERPRLAGIVAVAVGITTGFLLVPLGLFEISVSGLPAAVVFTIGFGALPVLAGVVCGWFRLGVLAAAASGIAPAVAFYLVVVVGATLGIGTFGGGDSPLAPFALLLGSPGFVLATVGFALTTIAIRRRSAEGRP